MATHAAPKSTLDSPSSVRAGEELNVPAVDAWLKKQVPTLEGLPTVTQFSGGASNWTYRLKYPKRDLILRRPPAGTKAKSAHDMSREYRVQKALRPAYPFVPEMVALCQDASVIGADFYVMERIEGIIPRANMPRGMNLSAGETRKLCVNVIDKLLELHAVDAQAVGLSSLGKGAGYPRRQVEGWSDRYEKARTWNVPSFKYVRDWLKDHIPDDIATCVIHNDWRFDNVVLDPGEPTQVIGVLDWEMATLGDPLMDLGSALAYWVESDDDFFMRATRRQPTHMPGMMSRREVVDYYLQRSGLKPASWTFYEVFGIFRLAGIIQQIYYRYHHKQTRNPAFKNFWTLVTYYDWRCKRLIKKGGR
ncbi:phosphotransferase family protein [Myxococcus sp. MISCRS1]|jgi:aminoglycoside phosphotransferase (APT) family kinase protein|uniref:phosphotransferase family protein n=1 Tax=Myxococcus TaxID=32 RepID=UPI001143A3D7|nr:MULTISPECIES: phosphotransferase family protein [Myxococcus]MBZ4394470.1 phosphotransferase family protein [Myxococcus sp. AS-1-15]MBZ4410564.1 phosphotransferase family protein [Myxococcus sp. XM-1-1-1]MCK8496935.1 phosphotransferase family protein [Myxococcus fulvus]MCY1001440.1 phosphotransferase family protein [Myxococcus sp. MISCRS1]